MLLYIYIKCFFSILIPIYVFLHLLNKKVSFKNTSLCVMTSIVEAFFIYFVRTHLPILIYITLLVITTITCLELFNEPFWVTFKTSTISNAFTSIIFFIASLIITPIAATIAYFWSEPIGLALAMLISGFIQLFLIHLIFKIRRFKKGMPFIYDINKGNSLMIISMLLLIVASIMTYQKEHSWIFSLYYCFILFCGITIYILWKFYIKKSYLNLVRERELSNLESIVKRQKLMIDKLTFEHDRLAEIVHRDNKIVPSLIMYVDELITLDDDNISDTSSKLYKIKNDLQQLMAERTTTLPAKNEHIFSFRSNISELDAIVNFLINKASEHNIELTTKIDIDITNLTPALISSFELTTIIGDLIDNAINACLSSTKSTENNSICLSFHNENDCYVIMVSDNGIPFDKKILNNLGKIKITSRKGKGGSGIGMFSTIQILKKCKASLSIMDLSHNCTRQELGRAMLDQDVLDNKMFSKSICICFDNLSEIRVNHNEVLYKRYI